MSIFNSSIIAREQCIPRVARAQHASYTQNFLSHNMLHALVCKLGCELYRSWSNLQIVATCSYNAFSVVLVFSMLSFGRIPLVVTNFFMPSLPGMILLQLATSFFMPKVFLHEYSIDYCEEYNYGTMHR